jgi:DNA-binding response OmpR family regulator
MTHLLVIEDEDEIRESLVMVLQSEGFEVTECGDGYQGIDKAIAIVPDLILCDILLPGIDGHEVLRQVRGAPTTSTVPFVFTSGLTDIRLGMNEGADDYIIKPYKMSVLIEAVKARLLRHELEKKYTDATAKLAAKEARTDLLEKLPDNLNNPFNKLIGSLQLHKEMVYPDLSDEDFKSSDREDIVFLRYAIQSSLELYSKILTSMKLMR